MIEMAVPPTEMVFGEGVRRLKRTEYETLSEQGCFDNERVELLFGVVVEKPMRSPEHDESVAVVHETIAKAIDGRARVRIQTAYVASDISVPEPDVFVIPNGTYWRAHPDHALLVIEVSRSSLRRDRAIKRPLYATGNVDEYWIVNHDDRCIEVYRDPRDGEWQTVLIFHPGEAVAMLAFPDVKIAVSEVLPPRPPA